jgi:hypothetical protein
MRNQIQEAIETAQQLRALWPNAKPIHIIDRLVVQLSATVEWGPLPERVSGFLWYYDDPVLRRPTPQIIINSNEPESRQLFSLAHEVYHCLAGHGGGFSHTDQFFRNRIEERAASRFSACTLMPEWRVREIIAQRGGPADIVREFEVSMEAARNRIDEIITGRL